jgi:hypothetical protein
MFSTLHLWSNDKPSKAQWLLYLPPGLTFKILDSAHRLHISLVSFSERRSRSTQGCTADDDDDDDDEDRSQKKNSEYFLTQH